GSFVIDFSNPGKAAAVFQVRSAPSAAAPRTYTVEAGKSLSDSWGVISVGTSEYDLSVYGPNGFMRAFKGTIGQGGGNLETLATYDESANKITLSITNRSAYSVPFSVLNVYGGSQSRYVVDPGKSVLVAWALALTFGWYDFVITADYDPAFQNRVAGHLETGQTSYSDPLMGASI